jgi:phosphoglycolate phosphatase-like HAD superfamily hydrolase
LFDIDGTLINTNGSGLEALKRAFQDTFGRPAPATILTAGRTDRGIVRDMVSAQAIEDSPAHWTAFCQAYLWHLADQLPRRKGYVLPGVAELLDELSARSDVAIGLLTGNIPEGARIKLEHFGLYGHFAFGGFGDCHVDRDPVAVAALHAARQAINGAVCLDRVWVIGDTPLDVRCARHIGAKAVAVATGMHAKSELSQANPDLLLDDLRQRAELIGLLDGGAA